MIVSFDEPERVLTVYIKHIHSYFSVDESGQAS